MGINELLIFAVLSDDALSAETRKKLRNSIEMIAQNAHADGVIEGIDKCLEVMESGIERIKLLELRDKLQW